MPQANHSLGVDHVTQAAKLIEESLVLLVQLEIRQEVVEAALSSALASGNSDHAQPGSCA